MRDQHDRRRVSLENSPDGQGLVEEYFTPITRRSEEIMDQFSSAELDVISRYLAATAAAMAAHHEFLIAAHHGGSAPDE